MRVTVRLLGGFSIAVDGAPVPDSAWSRRDPTALVKLLAHASGHRLHRERACRLDALWPGLDEQVALPRLHKAAHHARRALGSPEAVTLRAHVVHLLPGTDIVVDADEFETAARRALRARPSSAVECRAAADLFAGDFLPDDLTETWADEPRTRLRGCLEQLQHAAGGDRTTSGTAAVPRGVASPTAGPAAPSVGTRRCWSATLSSRPCAGPSGPCPQPARDDRVHQRRGGSGKSSLIRAFLRTVPPELAVAAGGCDDLLAARSLGPFRDMVDAEPAFGPLLAGDRPDDLLPGLFRVLAERSTLLVLEDVHWADDATLDAIRYLCRQDHGDHLGRPAELPGRRGRRRTPAPPDPREHADRCTATDPVAGAERRRGRATGGHR